MQLPRAIPLAFCLVLAACGAARTVQKTNNGGVLELSGEWTSAFGAAHAKMEKQCGTGNYAIVNEGRDITPEEGTKSNHAYRVYYECYANNIVHPKLP